MEKELPPVYADKESIQHVFTNILKNAVEASPEICQIILSTTFDEKKDIVKIKVRDFGTGMPDEIKPKIFDPFYSAKANGTGLGLSICNEIIQAHNGSIFFKKPEIDNPTPNVWDDHTNADQVQHSLGTICVITLPVSNEKYN